MALPFPRVSYQMIWTISNLHYPWVLWHKFQFFWSISFLYENFTMCSYIKKIVPQCSTIPLHGIRICTHLILSYLRMLFHKLQLILFIINLKKIDFQIFLYIFHGKSLAPRLWPFSKYYFPGFIEFYVYESKIRVCKSKI